MKWIIIPCLYAIDQLTTNLIFYSFNKHKITFTTSTNRLKNLWFLNENQHAKRLFYNKTLIIWSIQSLNSLVCASFNEDITGIVQNTLDTIIMSLLTLLFTLEDYIHQYKHNRKYQISQIDCLELINHVDNTINRIIITFIERFENDLLSTRNIYPLRYANRLIQYCNNID